MSFPSNTHTSPTSDESAGPTLADHLRTAAQYLRRHGWTRGTYYADLHHPSPRACALGAIGIAIHGEALTQPVTEDCVEAIDVLTEHLDTAYPFTFTDIAEWNDHPDRLATEVIAALEDAATGWETQHRTYTAERRLHRWSQQTTTSSSTWS